MHDQRKWQWLKARELKWEIESLICSAQEQALRTNAIKNGIDHHDVSRYAGRRKVHWLLRKKFEIECEDKWFPHQPEPVLENDKCKILWDFAIQTDKETEHRRQIS